jgi:hypothetical protein
MVTSSRHVIFTVGPTIQILAPSTSSNADDHLFAINKLKIIRADLQLFL